MKQILVLLILAALTVCLLACGGGRKAASANDAEAVADSCSIDTVSVARDAEVIVLVFPILLLLLLLNYYIVN